MSIAYEDPTTWRRQVGGTTIPYRVISTEGTFEPEAAACSMTMLVPASRLVDFATAMFPAAYLMGGFPVYTSRGGLTGTTFQATRISWKGHIDGRPVDPFGLDAAAPAGTYQDVCEVTVDYSTDRDQSESDPNDPETFLDVSCNGAGEFLTAPATEGRWAANAAAPPANDEPDSPHTSDIGIMVPQFEWDLTWPRIPPSFYSNTLVARLRAALGKVNSAVMPIFFNAPAETVLFVGFSLRYSFTWRTGTQPPFTCSMKFVEKRVEGTDGGVYGHNHRWRPGHGWEYLKCSRVIGGSMTTLPVYGSYNLNSMFLP